MHRAGPGGPATAAADAPGPDRAPPATAATSPTPATTPTGAVPYSPVLVDGLRGADAVQLGGAVGGDGQERDAGLGGLHHRRVQLDRGRPAGRYHHRRPARSPARCPGRRNRPTARPAPRGCAPPVGTPAPATKASSATRAPPPRRSRRPAPTRPPGRRRTTPAHRPAHARITAVPPVVLMHGFTQSAQSWDPVRTRLAAPRTPVVALDAPGHGTQSAQTADLPAGADLLVNEAPHPAAWIGYSMGGRFALYAALRHPDAVSRSVLVSATAGIDDPAERQARRQADEALAARIEPGGRRGVHRVVAGKRPSSRRSPETQAPSRAAWSTPRRRAGRQPAPGRRRHHGSALLGPPAPPRHAGPGRRRRPGPPLRRYRPSARTQAIGVNATLRPHRRRRPRLPPGAARGRYRGRRRASSPASPTTRSRSPPPATAPNDQLQPGRGDQHGDQVAARRAPQDPVGGGPPPAAAPARPATPPAATPPPRRHPKRGRARSDCTASASAPHPSRTARVRLPATVSPGMSRRLLMTQHGHRQQTDRHGRRSDRPVTRPSCTYAVPPSPPGRRTRRRTARPARVAVRPGPAGVEPPGRHGRPRPPPAATSPTAAASASPATPGHAEGSERGRPSPPRATPALTPPGAPGPTRTSSVPRIPSL